MGFMCSSNSQNREQAFFSDLVKKDSKLFCCVVKTKLSYPLFSTAGSQL